MQMIPDEHQAKRPDGDENEKNKIAANIYEYLTGGRTRQSVGEARSTIPEDTAQEVLPQANNYLRPEEVKQEDITLSLADLKTILEERNKKHEADLKTAEEKARQAKNKLTIARIGDAITAMSNLYFTYKGASNNFDPQKHGLSGKAKERYDKYIAEFDKSKQKVRKGGFDDLLKLYRAQKDGGKSNNNQELAERRHELAVRRHELAERRLEDVAQRHKERMDSEADKQKEKQTRSNSQKNGKDRSVYLYNNKGTKKTKYPNVYAAYRELPDQYKVLKRINTKDGVIEFLVPNPTDAQMLSRIETYNFDVETGIFDEPRQQTRTPEEIKNFENNGYKSDEDIPDVL